jgi:hypothetical protein
MKETELARHFVEYLSCYDLYYEVECSGGRVDILAMNSSIRIAYEVKTSFNFKVMEQAINHKPYFHYSYVACPYFKDNYFQKGLCRDYGIGLILCNANEWMRGNIEEVVRPKLNRHPKTAFRHELDKSYKESIPGCSGAEGGRITPFKVTVDNMIKYIFYHPGCSLKEMFKEVEHHYASDTGAKSSMYNWLSGGKLIPEIKIESGKLFLTEKGTEYINGEDMYRRLKKMQEF